ncbi:hypothetical protein H6G54_23540 [Anabaena cylindrica FACHB-243]|uniref:Uncharacterized protein n=1 Tax=Anabaena cylindrica (strain ATCC 27899 / PCC 7122) TaxID=272123 RepID=K9ZKE3_ANACC|nr:MULTISPECIES: hypothetical protein [Anabaena]AFZ59037.1 hypothetical protein Anacy_3644 [Anabaena cylindrica PCC 7122]MBD2420623.1 hypothetical protein [Anabaena cylindrica FACHB-243]MBY5285512.1 hypothetical protein [Anabaena sp. CCAP 1446/1C]MBY5309397.1 hypothetical protein [Anabaena sp. CCAP 1446/1C]MCM2408583.1 hypothetical protein [Anabaena sp. CCAP 1446/1C]
MSVLKRIPWFSLALVLLSYSTLGWVISETKAPWFVWLIVIVTILLLLISLTTPWSKLAEYYSVFFRSNVRTFGITVLAAFLFFMMLAWFRVFLDTLLILSATILVKIDFQAAGFKQGLSFWFTSIFSLAGLAVGALLYQIKLI